jgi:hypothetical protein
VIQVGEKLTEKVTLVRSAKSGVVTILFKDHRVPRPEGIARLEQLLVERGIIGSTVEITRIVKRSKCYKKHFELVTFRLAGSEAKQDQHAEIIHNEIAAECAPLLLNRPTAPQRSKKSTSDAHEPVRRHQSHLKPQVVVL